MSYKTKNKNYSKNRNFYKDKASFNKKPETFEPPKIIAHCFLCGTGISNALYMMSYNEHSIHFECALKKVKTTFTKERKNANFLVSYIGKSTFICYKQEKNKWNILKKYTLKEVIE